LPFEFEKEANEFLLKLLAVSKSLEKPSTKLIKSASCSQLNIFQENKKKRDLPLVRSLSSSHLDAEDSISPPLLGSP
jgi:hypothetical protein